MTSGRASGGERLFISYAGRDRAWADWVAWQLETVGFVVELDHWDWAAGDNAVLRMNEALGRADRVVALYSAAYFEPERFTTDEWTAVMAGPGRRGRLVPLRLEPATPPPVLASLVWRDLYGLNEAQARSVLLAAVAGGARPVAPPAFPAMPALEQDAEAGKGPRLPGLLPPVWKVPARNLAFTGRDGMLLRMRDRLTDRERLVVHALQGWGGVGKTQLALEFAYRFAGDYDAVWWVDSEQSELIGEQLAELAVALRVAAADVGVSTAIPALSAELRRRSRWLLVFDNATGPDEVRAWLPQGPGHVLVTSRSQYWTGVAEAMSVNVFVRAESVALLRRHLPTIGDADADRLASALGDLPLAVAQAGRLLAETSLTVDSYVRELHLHAGQVTAAGVPVDYPTSLAATVRLTADRLATEDRAAGQLLRLCAFLAPEPIPTDLFTASDALPQPLSVVVQSPLALATTVGRLGRYGLARVGQDGVLLHRLVQAIIRDSLTEQERTEARDRVDRLLVAAEPDDDESPALWPRWATLLPHVLAADLTGTANTGLRGLANSAVWHLYARGDGRAALPIAEHLHQQWRQRLGPDASLDMATNLAAALYATGEYQRARDLQEDVLTRRRRVHGDDHPRTLTSANNLVVTLHAMGEYQRARELAEDTFARRRRVLGDDYPNTLTSASNLAEVLGAMGEHRSAHDLAEETLARRRPLLGDDHPDTLMSAGNLAETLRAMGEHQRARELAEDTVVRQRRLLGDDHPDTLVSACNLAKTLHAMGEYQRARDLAEDTLARRRRVLGDDHPETLMSASNLAETLQALSDDTTP